MSKYLRMGEVMTTCDIAPVRLENQKPRHQIDSKITYPLLESIFYKNSPLHDGAIVIRNNRIVAARCILPVTNDDDFPGELGMRHRAAVGISEHSDALTIIVSEQNGKISCTQNGKIKVDLSEIQLRNVINKIN